MSDSSQVTRVLAKRNGRVATNALLSIRSKELVHFTRVRANVVIIKTAFRCYAAKWGNDDSKRAAFDSHLLYFARETGYADAIGRFSLTNSVNFRGTRDVR